MSREACSENTPAGRVPPSSPSHFLHARRPSTPRGAVPPPPRGRPQTLARCDVQSRSTSTSISPWRPDDPQLTARWMQDTFLFFDHINTCLRTSTSPTAPSMPTTARNTALSTNDQRNSAAPAGSTSRCWESAPDRNTLASPRPFDPPPSHPHGTLDPVELSPRRLPASSFSEENVPAPGTPDGASAQSSRPSSSSIMASASTRRHGAAGRRGGDQPTASPASFLQQQPDPDRTFNILDESRRRPPDRPAQPGAHRRPGRFDYDAHPRA